MPGRQLGCMSFVTTVVPHNVCGSNGLPLTPDSIKVLGLAQELLQLKQENLCQYVDFKCGKHDRIFAVSEYYLNNLKKRIMDSPTETPLKWYAYCLKQITGIFQGLNYMNQQGMMHLCLEPENILLSPDDTPKLSFFGMHHMTGSGKMILSPLGNAKYSSPEHIIDLYSSDASTNAVSFKSDVWSVAIILFEMLHKKILWEGVPIKEVLTRILHLCECVSSKTVIQKLSQSFERTVLLERDDAILKLSSVLENSLSVEQQYRMTAQQLLHEVLLSNDNTNDVRTVSINKKIPDINGSEIMDISPIDDIECDELWYLWNLAGGDMVSDVLKSVTTTASITKVPLFATSSGELLGLKPSPETLFDTSVTVLSMDTVEKRLIVNEDNLNFMYPLLELEDDLGNEHETSKLPILIKENDFEYQVYRIALFKRLLQAYPYLRDRLWKEARVDIPPFCRGKVWAGLLDVRGNIAEQYLHLDKETPILADRQIAVDIPRCHQYDPVLSSPVAHNKLRRVLKAWLMAHPHLTYWQGLDSLCAVFVYLNFNDEPCAFASLSFFIDKYLHKFFLKDNSPVIQEYLAVFSHLIAFHDPVLSSHLNEIHFIPDLYAIPWFLTMFAHVFPIHKVVHLWDTLLLGNSSFPLCIGVAILQQLRGQLLQNDFNECILLFSDLPEVDIDNVVKKSVQIFCDTPKSSTFRAHAEQSSLNKREPVSYYSDDYNALPKNELSEMSIPLSELKNEVCCRISADDLIQLCELRGNSSSKTPAKSSRSSKPRICVIDIRPSDEFTRGAIPSSLNFHYPSNKSSSFIQSVVQQKPKVTVVVGNQSSKDDKQFAAELVKSGLKGVCLLHGGIDILKPTGVLVVP